MTKPDFRAERDLRARGFWPVAGIDEAGRGPLAGPVAAAAVILDPGKLPRGLNDSKKLTPGERDRLYDEILLHASAVAVAFASAVEIDQSQYPPGDVFGDAPGALRAFRHAQLCSDRWQ